MFLRTDSDVLVQVRGRFTPAQWELFLQMQPADQRHALRIFQRLVRQGENQPDLLLAALLHDVGKLRYRLNPLERAMVVLVEAIQPGQAKRWGSLPPAGWDDLPGWRKAFILAAQHADWGAEMAGQVGATSLTVTLIRYHHQPTRLKDDEWMSSLLNKLWLLDNES